MKIIRKSISMNVVYVMGVTLLPIGAQHTIASAETDTNYNYTDSYAGDYKTDLVNLNLEDLKIVEFSKNTMVILSDCLNKLIIAEESNDPNLVKEVLITTSDLLKYLSTEEINNMEDNDQLKKVEIK